MIPFRKPPQERNPFVEYELLKSQWVANNPDATPQEYQQAMQRIAQQAGV